MNAIPIDAGEAPREVRDAFRIYVAHICVTAVAVILPVVFTPPVLRLVEQQMVRVGTPPDNARFVTVLSLGIIALVGLLVLGIELLLARRMYRGGRRARLLLTVLSCLWVALFAFRSDQLISMLAGGPAVAAGAVLQIAGVVLLVAAGSFMFRPAVAPWFARA